MAEKGEKGTTEGEMVGRHHQLDRHEFVQVLGVGDRQGSLVCCGPCGHKESDTTEQLNQTKDSRNVSNCLHCVWTQEIIF